MANIFMVLMIDEIIKYQPINSIFSFRNDFV